LGRKNQKKEKRKEKKRKKEGLPEKDKYLSPLAFPTWRAGKDELLPKSCIRGMESTEGKRAFEENLVLI